MSGMTARGATRIATAGWGALTLKMALYEAGSGIVTTTNVLSDLAAGTEITNAGYARAAVAQTAPTEDDAGFRAVMDAADVNFGAVSAGDTPAIAVVYEDGASDATRNVISWHDITGAAPNGTAYVVQIAGSGLVTGSV